MGARRDGDDVNKEEMDELSGPEFLRRVVGNMDAQNEACNEQFTPEQWLTITRAHLACEYDFYPDQWSARQIREALRGIVPRFREATGTERNTIDGYVPEYLAKHLHDHVAVTPKARAARGQK